MYLPLEIILFTVRIYKKVLKYKIIHYYNLQIDFMDWLFFRNSQIIIAQKWFVCSACIKIAPERSIRWVISRNVFLGVLPAICGRVGKSLFHRIIYDLRGTYLLIYITIAGKKCPSVCLSVPVRPQFSPPSHELISNLSPSLENLWSDSR